MNLEDFVTGALVSIAKGVKAANNGLASNGVVDAGAGQRPQYFQLGSTGSEIVTFDVAVSAEHESHAGGGARFSLYVVAGDASGKGKVTEETVSRVKFAVRLHGQLG